MEKNKDKENNMSFEKFTHQYSLQKTLRFELKPIGSANTKLQEIVAIDKQRAEDYRKTVKPLLDKLHKNFIENTLKKISDFEEVISGGINHAYQCYQTLKQELKDQKRRENWTKSQKTLREAIANVFKQQPEYKSLTKEVGKLFPGTSKKAEGLLLETFSDFTEEEKNCLKKFTGFTTYFINYQANRNNMYTSEEQTTSIAHRIVNDNMPKFFANCERFAKLRNTYLDLNFSIVEQQLATELGTFTVADIFQPSYFIQCFSQSGIDLYNTVLGGKTIADNQEKIKGINEIINLYKQQQPKERQKQISKMVPLFKQILSDRESVSFIPEKFTSDTEMLHALRCFAENYQQILTELQKLLETINEYSVEDLFIDSRSLNDIAKNIFGDWGKLKRILEYYAEIHYKTKKERKVYLEKFAYSFAELQTAYTEDSSDNKLEFSLHDYFACPKNKEQVNIFDAIKNTYQAFVPILEKKQLNKRRDTPIIKDYVDALSDLLHTIKPLHLDKKKNTVAADAHFYDNFDLFYTELRSAIMPLYDKVRNYLTKKPYSIEKFKLNFNNSSLLSGWDVNKEKDNFAVLLLKDNQYYLAIMNEEHKKIFEQAPESKVGNNYQKIMYKLLPGASKMLPKVFFSKKNMKYYNPSEKIIAIRNHGSHTKQGKPRSGYRKQDFSLDDCHAWIDFCKASLAKHSEWKNFNFKFQETQYYNDVSEFYKEVEQQGYNLNFKNIDADYIQQQVDAEKLYLFQIYNKDFSPHSTGTPNLHTLYWRGLFEASNLENVCLKLNGEAEIFYREQSLTLQDTTVHDAYQAIDNKNPLNSKRKSQFEYPIIKNKRFTTDKYFFHVPITLNFKSSGAKKFNQHINQHLSVQEELNIIGIDRGERHLLYYSIINQYGEIIEQGSFNTVSDQYRANGELVRHDTDYHALLDEKEKQRDEARKSWQTVENIKELKAGYLSQVVHKLAALMIKHNAIIALEDLNFGFKRGRFKVEKQVYQKFEKALIDKLNYLVFKDFGNGEAGYYLNAYQLTAPFESFQKLNKQSGCLFYVPAAYTSKIDPITGFSNLIYSKYENVQKAQQFFQAFTSIRYDKFQDYFVFSVNFKKILPNKDMGEQTQWDICTVGDKRYQYDSRSKKTIEVNVSEELKHLFTQYAIAYQQGDDVKATITAQTTKEFFMELLRLFNLTMNLRHSCRENGDDFILSPVAPFFDSRQYKNDDVAKYPKDADANGAYHIALKGLLLLQRIQKRDAKLNLTIKNQDWFNFVQQKPYARSDDVVA